MVTTLYLIRHGETAGGDAKRYHGSIDIPLSVKGEGQIREAADRISSHLKNDAPARNKSYLKDIHRAGEAGRDGDDDSGTVLKAVYCSDLSRAKKSAEIIAGYHQADPVEMPELRERSFGIWEGMTFTEIRDIYPGEFASWAENPVAYSPPGGESTLGVRDRVIPAFERILAGHKGDNIAIVAHGGVNRVLLCHILGIPLENIFRIEQDHAAVNIIEFWDLYPVVRLLNG